MSFLAPCSSPKDSSSHMVDLFSFPLVDASGFFGLAVELSESRSLDDLASPQLTVALSGLIQLLFASFLRLGSLTICVLLEKAQVKYRLFKLFIFPWILESEPTFPIISFAFFLHEVLLRICDLLPQLSFVSSRPSLFLRQWAGASSALDFFLKDFSILPFRSFLAFSISNQSNRKELFNHLVIQLSSGVDSQINCWIARWQSPFAVSFLKDLVGLGSILRSVFLGVLSFCLASCRISLYFPLVFVSWFLN